MVDRQVFARLWEKTLAVHADTLGQLLLAGWVPEIGGRASNIMNIALEILILYHTLCLCKNGSMTARLHNASLMESQGTEITAAKTAAVTDQVDLGNSRDPAIFFIDRVIGAHIRQGINIIHFLHGKRLLRWILHHIDTVRIGFCHLFGTKGICILILGIKTLGICLFIGRNLLIRRQKDGIFDKGSVLCPKDCPTDIGDILNVDAGGKCLCDLNDRTLAHTIGDQVCTGIHQNGPFDLI